MSNKPRRYNKKKNRRPFDNYVPPFDAALLAEPIENLTLSEELSEKLKKGKVNSLLDIARREEKDFYRISTFNKKNLMELKKAIRAKNITFKPEPIENLSEPKPENKKDTQVVSEQTGKKQDTVTDTENKRVRNPKSRRNQSRNRNADNRRSQETQVSEKATKEQRERQRPQRVAPSVTQDIYIKINRNNKWGFADRKGKEVIAPIYDEIFSFKEDVCCVEKDELFGYIDRQGEEIIPIMYECATSFSEGYACVYKNGYCGYIDKQNNVVIDFKFDAGTAVIDGNCRVKRDGKWGELHLDNPYEIRWIN